MHVCQLDISALKQETARILGGHTRARQVLGIYLAISLGLPLLVSLLGLFLGGKADALTGLSNLQSRSMLIALQAVLNLLVSLAMPMWDGGYANAILDVSRGNAPGQRWYFWGFGQWKAFLACGLLLLLQAFALVYLAAVAALCIVFMSPLISTIDASALESAVAAGDMDAAMSAMAPALIACVLAASLVMLMLYYRYRFLYYTMRDDGGKLPLLRLNAMASAVSKNCRLQLLKLDLSYWWYYLLRLLAYAVAYLDVILVWLGKPLPCSQDAAAAVLMVAYTLCSAGITYLGKNRVSVSFALAYGKIRESKGI